MAIIPREPEYKNLPAHVLIAAQELRRAAPDLYPLIARFENTKTYDAYSRAKFLLERSSYNYSECIRLVVDFVNV